MTSGRPLFCLDSYLYRICLTETYIGCYRYRYWFLIVSVVLSPFVPVVKEGARGTGRAARDVGS